MSNAHVDASHMKSRPWRCHLAILRLKNETQTGRSRVKLDANATQACPDLPSLMCSASRFSDAFTISSQAKGHNRTDLASG